jgi:glycosyltransferase involved in cell wall biosynthesis
MREKDKNGLSYVLVTPARNEEAYITKTLESVIQQTVLPKKWVIVSDASTDATDAIVKGYTVKYPWIELIRMPEKRDRSFAAKVGCFRAGFELVKDMNYDIVGNLDADISFDNDYFEFLLDKFESMPDLGVAGTPFIEEGYSSVADSYEGEKHVAGACQLFRRKCFEDVGGYIAIKGGGIDWAAVTTARMKGWVTRSFKEKYFHHYRKLGTGESNRIKAIFSYGLKDYYLGGHPLWQLFRVVYRSTKRPYLVAGLVLSAGYFWGFLTMRARPISDELMRFHRKEQLEKLREILKAKTFRNKVTA